MTETLDQPYLPPLEDLQIHIEFHTEAKQIPFPNQIRVTYRLQAGDGRFRVVTYRIPVQKGDVSLGEEVITFDEGEQGFSVHGASHSLNAPINNGTLTTSTAEGHTNA